MPLEGALGQLGILGDQTHDGVDAVEEEVRIGPRLQRLQLGLERELALRPLGPLDLLGAGAELLDEERREHEGRGDDHADEQEAGQRLADAAHGIDQRRDGGADEQRHHGDHRGVGGIAQRPVAHVGDPARHLGLVERVAGERDGDEGDVAGGELEQHLRPGALQQPLHQERRGEQRGHQVEPGERARQPERLSGLGHRGQPTSTRAPSGRGGGEGAAAARGAPHRDAAGRLTARPRRSR